MQNTWRIQRKNKMNKKKKKSLSFVHLLKKKTKKIIYKRRIWDKTGDN